MILHNDVASKLASCFAVDRTLQGPGVMWRPWPGLQALSSVSGSSCGRCLTTSAPALRERGKGEGGKDARAAVNNPHLQQWQQQRYRFPILYLTHLCSALCIHSLERNTGSQRFFVCFPLAIFRILLWRRSDLWILIIYPDWLRGRRCPSGRCWDGQLPNPTADLWINYCFMNIN